MSQIVDPYAVADLARGATFEAVIETGRRLPGDSGTITSEYVDSETMQAEIERIDKEFNEECLILRAERLEQELGRIADVLDTPEARELTADEARDVELSWTTPASRRALPPPR